MISRGLFLCGRCLSRQKAPGAGLLLLADFGKDRKPEAVIAKISQESVAEIIGTTRSRVSFFCKLGFVAYDSGGLSVRNSLLSVLLHD